MDSRDIFHYQTKILAKDRHQLTWILIVLGFNVLVLLSLTFDFRWWRYSQYVTAIIGFVYVLLIYGAYNGIPDERGRLFEIGRIRKRHWRDYYTSEEFVKKRNSIGFCYYYECAPIRSGGYLCINKGEDYEYVRVDAEKSFIGKDIDLNKVYYSKIRIVALTNNKEHFNASEENFSIAELLKKMQDKLEKDGYRIVSSYNEYGDLMWSRSDTPTKKSTYRKVCYYVEMTLWFIVAFIAFIAPLVPMIKDIY